MEAIISSADRVRHLRRIRTAVRSQSSVTVLRLAEDRVWTNISRIQDSDIRRGAQEIFRVAVKPAGARVENDSGQIYEALRDGIGDLINFLEASK
jgi:hypothetical protein